MQPLPPDVLQRREQQRKIKAKARRRGSRGTAEARREVDSGTHASHEAPLRFATEDRSYATSSSSASSQSPPFQGASAPKASRGGRAGALRPPVSTLAPPQVRVETHKRPPLGPRTQAPPSWPSAPETVPPQLIGGRAGPDARGVMRHRKEGIEGGADSAYFDAYLGPRLEASTQSSSHTQQREVPQDPIAPVADDPLNLNESPATSTDTVSSKDSYASSFAYLLRNRRSDKRLFHKRSQPRQHLQNRTSSSRPEKADAARSPSYYRPKIVEDTLTPLQYVPPPFSPASPLPALSGTPILWSSPQHIMATPHQPSPSPSARTRERSSSSNSPARNVRSHSPIRSRGPQRPDSHQKPKARVSESSLGQKTRVPARKGLQIASPTPYSRLAEKDGKSDNEDCLDPMIAGQRSSISEIFAGASGSFTPTEIRTLSPKIAHGDHYFRTFGEDTVYEKPRVDALPESRPSQAAAVVVGKPSGQHTQVDKHPSDHLIAHHEDRKHRNLLLALRRLPLTDSTLDMSNKTQRSPSPLPYDPTKSFLALSRHTRTSTKSDGSASSYFALGRRKQNSSDHPLSTPSPLPTHWEPARAGPGHTRDQSSPLSPLTTKLPKLRWSHQLITEPSAKRASQDDGSTLLERPNTAPAALSPAAVAHTGPPQLRYKSSDGKEYPATSLTAPDAPNFLPSEMKRIDTPPLKEANTGRDKLRAFRSFFFDSSSLPTPNDPRIRPRSRKSGTLFERHASETSKRSLQSLVPKLSWSWLLDSPSQASGDPLPSDPLEVTGFRQTPFSQRYGDARRAKQTQMRAYIWDETLREDDDSPFGSVGQGFELSVPDHLTNSPLCPLNEKHRSGGKAICPIHGRKRMGVNAYPLRGRATARGDGNRSGRREPTIVFESGKREYDTVGMSGGGDESQQSSNIR